ncbi:uncharacterized protein ACB058_017880 [Synchiropus picturatus]
MTTLKSALGSARKQREQIGVPLCRMRCSVPLLLPLLSALVSRALADCWDPQDGGGLRTRRENLKSEVPSEASLFWDELRGLKQMVLSLKAAEVAQRQVLRRAEARLRDRELEGEQQKQSLERLRLRVESDGRQLQEQLRALREADLQALESRVNASERAAAGLKQRSAALAEALPFLQTRLRASEVTVVELQRKNTDLASRLCGAESGLEQLRRRSSGQPGAPPHPPASDGSSGLERRSSSVAGVESRLRSAQAQAERPQSAVGACNVSSGLEAQLDWARSSILGAALQVGVASLQNRSQATPLESGLAARLDRITSSLRGLELRQGAGEEQLRQRLQEGGAAQEAALRRVRARLNVSEERLQRQETWSSGAEARLRSSQERVEQLQSLASEVTNRSLAQASQLESRVGARLEQIFSRLQGGPEPRWAQTPEEPCVCVCVCAGAEGQLRASEDHLSSDVGPRLERAEQLLESVKRSSSVQEVAVQRLRWRLNVSQEHLQQLESRSSAQGSSVDSLALTLNTTGGQLHRLETWNSELSRRLTAAEEQLERRRAQTAGAPRVAFSAGLADAGAVGPFDEETTLVFSKSVTNEGGAYDPTTGVFTSPLRGLYFFSFTAADFIKGYMGVKLYHNRQPVLFSLQLNDHGGYASTCGGVTLLLEERDRVRLSLPATYRLYDDSRNFSFFSGFLLFPL